MGFKTCRTSPEAAAESQNLSGPKTVPNTQGGFLKVKIELSEMEIQRRTDKKYGMKRNNR